MSPGRFALVEIEKQTEAVSALNCGSLAVPVET